MAKTNKRKKLQEAVEDYLIDSAMGSVSISGPEIVDTSDYETPLKKLKSRVKESFGIKIIEDQSVDKKITGKNSGTLIVDTEKVEKPSMILSKNPKKRQTLSIDTAPSKKRRKKQISIPEPELVMGAGEEGISGPSFKAPQISGEYATIAVSQDPEEMLMGANINNGSITNITSSDKIYLTKTSMSKTYGATEDQIKTKLSKKLFISVSTNNTESSAPGTKITEDITAASRASRPYELSSADITSTNSLYKYSPVTMENARVKSGDSLRNSIVLYKGNIFINGRCYGTYTGYLENRQQIAALQQRCYDLENRLTAIETMAKNLLIERSTLTGSNENLKYLWEGTQASFDSLATQYNSSDANKEGTKSWQFDRSAFIIEPNS